MEIWQIVLLSYPSALVLWLIINSFFLLISFIFKVKIFVVLEGICAILAVLLGLATGLGDLALIIWLFMGGHYIWAIILFFLGLGIISFIGQLLATPFIFITGLFSGWYESVKEA